jgi:hypothetical protein
VSSAASAMTAGVKSPWISWLSDAGVAEGGCEGGRLLEALEALDSMVEARESNWIPPMISSSFLFVSDGGQVSEVTAYHPEHDVDEPGALATWQRCRWRP